MPSGVRSNSLLVTSTPSGLVSSLDDAVEFMDRFGVPRRRVSHVEARRLVLRGSSLSSLDAVRIVFDQVNDEPEDDAEEELAELIEMAMEPDFVPHTLEEKLAVERAHQARMLRRQRMILEIRDRKRTLLVNQHAQILERVQLWNEALALDPEADLTSANTVLSPSSKAQAYIDDDGNVRRKSSIEYVETTGSGSPTKTAAVVASMATAVARKSLVLEFVQALIDD